MAADQRSVGPMRRAIVFALFAAATAAILLLRLDQGLELLAWEATLLTVLFILFRIFPKAGWEPSIPLFGRHREEPPRPPRSVSSFELAAVHAYSESPGADQRLRVMMQRIASHRLARRGMTPVSGHPATLVEEALFQNPEKPLTVAELRRVVDQLENL